MKRDGVAREHVAMAFAAPPDAADWAATADLLAYYLGAPSNSRFFWSIIQKGLADEATSDYYGFSDTGLFYIYASVDPQNVTEVMEIIQNELDKLKSGVDEDALERARTKLATALVTSGENGLRRFSQIVDRLSTDTPLRSLEEELAEIDSVTPERIAGYLEAFPVNGESALVALGPMEHL